MILLWKASLGALLGAILLVQFVKADLTIYKQWYELEFEFPSNNEKAEAIASGKYVRGAATPIDVDVLYRDQGRSKVFITIPRFVKGIPITFGVVTSIAETYGPVIRAYPDYNSQSSHGMDCDGITSVFRVQIDECNRLWVLDSGRIEETQHCPPQLLVYNLENDKLIHRYRIPEGQYKRDDSLLVTPIVDVRDPEGKCRETFVYIADVSGFGLIVYDMRNERSWRTTNKLMFPAPDYGTFNISGETFDLMDGILGMSLSPRRYGVSGGGGGYGSSTYGSNSVYPSERTLYFHALASNTENSVSTSVLTNFTSWHDATTNPRDFEQLGNRGHTQSAAEAIDRNGIMFFGLMNPNAIACWDTRTRYEPRNIHIVAQNDATLQFASGVKIVNNLRGVQELWVLTCSFQKIMTGSITNESVNFRIQALQVSGLLKNGRCVSQASSSSMPSTPRPQSSSGYSPLVFPQ